MRHQAEYKESHEQFGAAWSLYARSRTNGAVLDADGLCIANARHPWALMNTAVLTKPLSSQADLASRAIAAIRYYRDEPTPWFFAAGQQWLGEGADSTLSALGLSKTGSAVAMVTEALTPPARALPDAETRPIVDAAGRLALADLNADAYGVPSDWAREIIRSDALWERPLYGTIAWMDGQPVSTALVLPQNGTLYVAWVATAEAYRRRGLADLVMRRSLEQAHRDTGLTRTALHATDEGYPAYLKMGYRAIDTFSLYGLA